MDITLRQLSYFTTLAETRHFGRAAERLHITQPALSTQIRELEDRLGVTLILRGRAGRGFALTPAGHRLLHSAQTVLAEVGALPKLLARSDRLEGALNLGMIPTVAPYLLPELLPELRTSHPDLTLRLREARTEELLDDLTGGRLDAAVVALPAGAPDLVERALFSECFVLAGSPADLTALAARDARLTPDALDPARILLLDEGHCLADQALAVCGLNRADMPADLGAASLATLAGLAAAGYGVTFLPEMALSREKAGRAGGLALTRFAAPEPGRVIGLVRAEMAGATGWFDELAGLLAAAGRRLLAQAKRL